MHKNLLIITLLLLLLTAFSSSLISFSDGPPESRTGAPGELTCFNGSCHNSFLLNSGDAILHIDTDFPGSGYVPGQTYTLSPAVSDSGMRRFGFEMMAYSPNLNGSVGAFITTDSNRTQLKYNEMNGREYIQHDSAMAAIDSARWAFGWTAPDSLVGDIVFYAAFVAANNDQKRSGDYVFTHAAGVGEDTLRVGIMEPPIKGLQIFVDQQAGKIRIIGQVEKPQMITMEILDLQGRLVRAKKVQLHGAFNVDLPTTGWEKGVYIVRLKEWAIARKMMIR